MVLVSGGLRDSATGSESESNVVLVVHKTILPHLHGLTMLKSKNKNNNKNKKSFAKGLRSPRNPPQAKPKKVFGRHRSHTHTGTRPPEIQKLSLDYTSPTSSKISRPSPLNSTSQAQSYNQFHAPPTPSTQGMPPTPTPSDPINTNTYGDISSRSSDLDLYRKYSSREAQYASHSDVNCPFRFLGRVHPLLNEGLDVINTRSIDKNSYHVWKAESSAEILKRKNMALKELKYEKGMKASVPFPLSVLSIPDPSLDS